MSTDSLSRKKCTDNFRIEIHASISLKLQFLSCKLCPFSHLNHDEYTTFSEDNSKEMLIFNSSSATCLRIISIVHHLYWNLTHFEWVPANICQQQSTMLDPVCVSFRSLTGNLSSVCNLNSRLHSSFWTFCSAVQDLFGVEINFISFRVQFTASSILFLICLEQTDGAHFSAVGI